VLTPTSTVTVGQNNQSKKTILVANTDRSNLKNPLTLNNTPLNVEEEIMLDESPRANHNSSKPAIEFTGALSP
jgi:hypothetical protein